MLPLVLSDVKLREAIITLYCFQYLLLEEFSHAVRCICVHLYKPFKMSGKIKGFKFGMTVMKWMDISV